MSHVIIIIDGVEVGRLEHPPEEGGSGLIVEPEHEAITLTLNRKPLAKLLYDVIKQCDKHDKDNRGKQS